MNCQQAQLWQHAYLDGELDLANALEMERHVNECDSCAKSCDDVRELRFAVRSASPAFKAPANLWESVKPFGNNGSIQIQYERPEPRRHFSWINWAFPTAIAAVVAWMLFTTVATNSSNHRILNEIASSHVRSLQANHLMDVASTDQHTVKPWFDGKLDFAPPVINLATNNFPLVGGRLDFIAEHPVAALVYQRDKHLINLFVWPVASQNATSDKFHVERGYNILHWETAGMTFWAVSDLNRGELEKFEHLLRSPPASPSTP